MEEVDDFKSIELKLCDEKTLRFVDGVWMSLKKNHTAEHVDDVSKLHKTNQKLDEENIMLTAKMDILLDLLSEALAERETMSMSKKWNKLIRNWI